MAMLRTTRRRVFFMLMAAALAGCTGEKPVVVTGTGAKRRIKNKEAEELRSKGRLRTKGPVRRRR